MKLNIVDFASRPQLAAAMAAILYEAFREHWPEAWPELAGALDETNGFLDAGRIACIAVEETGEPVGWIGGIPEYNGNVWELHPLAVRPDRQGQGIGRALVQNFERQVVARGGSTIVLGTDDEDGMTSIAGIDLFPDPLAKLAGIRNLRRHPFEFYRKMGFAITGVVPDANGPGKPDILMAKRVARLTANG